MFLSKSLPRSFAATAISRKIRRRALGKYFPGSKGTVRIWSSPGQRLMPGDTAWAAGRWAFSLLPWGVSWGFFKAAFGLGKYNLLALQNLLAKADHFLDGIFHPGNKVGTFDDEGCFSVLINPRILFVHGRDGRNTQRIQGRADRAAGHAVSSGIKRWPGDDQIRTVPLDPGKYFPKALLLIFREIAVAANDRGNDFDRNILLAEKFFEKPPGTLGTLDGTGFTVGLLLAAHTPEKLIQVMNNPESFVLGCAGHLSKPR